MSGVGLLNVTLLVKDYDEAIQWFTEKLRFTVVEDTKMSEDGSKRWVRIRPPKAPANSTCILLAKASGEMQETTVGSQFGGRVGFFLETDDFADDFLHMKDAGVRFKEDHPREEAYATVIKFADLHGNQWDLIQTRKEPLVASKPQEQPAEGDLADLAEQ